MKSVSAASRLPRSVPEQEGLPSQAVQSLLDELSRQGQEIHSLMLVRHGQVVAEGWWDPYGPERRHHLFSLSKSFVSTAVGFAVSEGLLSTDDLLTGFFPDKLPASPSPLLEQITLHHLLTMSSGHERDPFETLNLFAETDWVRAYLHTEPTLAPGSRFVYSSAATYMLSAVVSQVTGMNLLDYLEPRLLQPLGIEGAYWRSCPAGIPVGGWGLHLTTEDIAKFGQFYLQKGVWDGRSLLPEEWIAEATSKQIGNGDDKEDNDWTQGYGYQFWRCRHGLYRGDGAFGQFCIVMPDQDAVLAITAGSNDMSGIMNAVWEKLLPSLGTTPIHDDPEAQAGLAATMRQLILSPPEPSSSPLEDDISGLRYRLSVESGKDPGWTSLTLHFAGEHAKLAMEGPEIPLRATLGRGAWNKNGEFPSMDGPRPLLAAFGWSDDATMVFEARLIETPTVLRGELSFREGELILKGTTGPTFNGQDEVVLRGTV